MANLLQESCKMESLITKRYMYIKHKKKSIESKDYHKNSN